jgi:hypothetical protein
MPDQKQSDPFHGETKSSDEYGFDPEANPLHKDEQQAEASEYGIYGYQGEPGQAFEGDRPPERTPAPPPPADSDPAVTPAEGGQEWHESEHGAGFDQPMAGPQRHASRSPLPDEEAPRDLG